MTAAKAFGAVSTAMVVFLHPRLLRALAAYEAEIHAKALMVNIAIRNSFRSLGATNEFRTLKRPKANDRPWYQRFDRRGNRK